jgi:tripartite-type tricarboxylate transporter receptor subunit TctC
MLLKKKLVALYLSTTLLAGGSAVAGPARSDAGKFPEKPVRIIVSTSAGASSDMLTRTVARKLSELWGKSVVVENVPGASGNIGIKRVADATPDGYTLLASGSGLPISANQSGLGFDPATSFAAITQAVVNPAILVVRNDLGPKNFADYIAYTKKRNGNLLFGLTALGGLHHIANELIAQQTGTRYNYIPYKGGAPATIELLGGQIDAMLITLAAVTEHVRGGRLTAIAVTTRERSKALPDVPPLAEVGLPGFNIGSWQGFLAPAGTPRTVVDKIYQDMVTVLKSHDVNQFLEGQGYNIRATSPVETDRLIQSEIGRFRQVIRTANLVLQ